MRVDVQSSELSSPQQSDWQSLAASSPRRSLGPILVGCPIKGNISKSTGERIYHSPGQEYCTQTRISGSQANDGFARRQMRGQPGADSIWRLNRPAAVLCSSVIVRCRLGRSVISSCSARNTKLAWKMKVATGGFGWKCGGCASWQMRQSAPNQLPNSAIDGTDGHMAISIQEPARRPNRGKMDATY